MSIEYGFLVEPKGKTQPLVDQIHSNLVIPLSSKGKKADGIYTDKLHDPVYIFVADCLPLLFFSDHQVAAVHCGWKGALGLIAQNTLKTLAEENLSVLVGPSIGVCCFQVKEDFIDAFKKENLPVQDFIEKRNGNTHFDLLKFVLHTQLSSIPSHRVYLKHWRCTYCSQPELPSYRRLGNTDIRIRAWITKI